MLSSTEAELIVAVNYANDDRFLRSMIQVLGFKQESSTPIYEGNNTPVDIVNSIIPTEMSNHIDVRFFAIKGYKEAGYITMHHIPIIINPADDVTKPLGWVLHYMYAIYLMGH